MGGRSGEENLRKSEDYFEQAIEKDPGYAAGVGRAGGHLRLGWGTGACFRARIRLAARPGGRRKGTGTRQQPRPDLSSRWLS